RSAVAYGGHHTETPHAGSCRREVLGLRSRRGKIDCAGSGKKCQWGIHRGRWPSVETQRACGGTREGWPMTSDVTASPQLVRVLLLPGMTTVLDELGPRFECASGPFGRWVIPGQPAVVQT